MRISALDALQRGLLNLRANPTLVLLQVLQGIVVALFVIAGLVPLVLAVGMGLLRAFMEAGSGANPFDPGPIEEIAALVEQAAGQWQMLLAALLAGVAVWTVGFLVYCWAQAGILGTLAVGEERAAASARPVWRDFRAYSWPDFVRMANAQIWQYFWLINLLVTVALGLLLVFVLGLSLLSLFFDPQAGLGPAIVLGCLIFVVGMIVWLALFGWMQLAKAELAITGRGIFAAFRRSFATFWRRLGAVIILLVLFFAASMALAVVFLPLSLGLDVAMGADFGRQLFADGLVGVLQSAVGAAVSLALAAAAIALVKGER